MHLFSEGKRLPTLSEKKKYQDANGLLTNEERQTYNEMAQNEEATSTVSKKKEMRRALSSLTNIVSIHQIIGDVNKPLPQAASSGSVCLLP